MVIANTNTPQNKVITILGSTGSIGRNTVHLIEQSETPYQVYALTGNSNVSLLAEQAIRLNAKLAVIANEQYYDQLKHALVDTNIQCAAGYQAVIDAASYDKTDFVMSAIVGAAGLESTLAAIKQSNATIGLANKECLVCAGQLMMDAIKEHNTTLIPVDSEHSAIFQVLDNKHSAMIENLTLTASGGPFRTYTAEQLKHVTPSQAIAHPNWKMGKKISIDSATMMNKGLEIIEAFHLFPVRAEQIKVLIHPESIIHSMVNYQDGSTLAQLGTADMCTPIAVALSWPKRMKTAQSRLNLAEIGKLTFEEPNTQKFPAIQLAKEVLSHNNLSAASIIFNAANEVAVAEFLENNIAFTNIVTTVDAMLHNDSYFTPIHTIDDVIALDKEIRHQTNNHIKNHYAVAA